MVNNTSVTNSTCKKATLSFSKKKFFKVTNKYENHRGFKYKTGLNILKEEFAKTGSCIPGGLYFTNKKYLEHFYGYGVNLREVSVLQGAQVVQDGVDKYRTDKLILNKKYKLYSVETQKLLKLKVTGLYLSEYIKYTKDKKEIIKNFVEKHASLLNASIIKLLFDQRNN